MPPKLARLAGLGAFAVSFLLLALIVLFIVATWPSGSSGLDGTERFLAWFGVAGVLLALIGVHVVLGRRLLAVARGTAEPL
jgi:succinate dehydrogenase/fumarate reductase cytochrome b subunit